MSHSSSATVAKLQPQGRGSETAPDHGYSATAVVRHLSHELRQPLSTIESIAYYLEMVLPPQDRKARVQVEKLQQLVQQAGWILSDAVHYLQALPPVPQVLDLDEFVSDAVRDSSKGARLWVRMDLATAPTLVQSDPGQLRHLLRNVLFFFRQVSKPDPRVDVRTSCSREGVSLEVRTEAVDCSPAELEAMFDPFSPHAPAGSGLALASVRRIAEANRATLHLECDANRRLGLTVSFPAVS